MTFIGVISLLGSYTGPVRASWSMLKKITAGIAIWTTHQVNAYNGFNSVSYYRMDNYSEPHENRRIFSNMHLFREAF